MIKPLLDFRARLATHEQDALDASRILTLAIRGFSLSILIPPMSSPVRPASSGSPSVLTVISRLSCRRAGTRFNARGIDDEGNVANFVETETLFCTPSGLCFSYVQIRGSVPVFWEQAPGLIPGQQKIQVARSAEATQPAFDKHFDELERKYGAVHVVNLLSETKSGEMDLTNRYRYHVRHSPLNGDSEAGTNETLLLRETEFDFHVQTRGPTGYVAAEIIKPQLQDSAEQFAYFLCELADPGRSTTTESKMRDGHPKMTVILQQEGIFRTNCLDCLDRTNIIQTLISRTALEAFLDHCHGSAESDFWIRHSSLWADNGDVGGNYYGCPQNY